MSNEIKALDEQSNVEQAKENIDGRKWAVFSLVAIGVFMATLDASIVNVSLPAIARDFRVPLNGTIEWVLIAYLVVTAALLLTAGRLSDMVGRKVIWIIGLIIFTGSSALCGLAFSLWFLIAARALQGIGGALLYATSPALLISAFSAKERGRALGLNTVTVALGTSIGPTLGGIITNYFSWRGIFYVNLPFGILGIILTLIILREPKRQQASRFDPIGAFLLAIGLASLAGALSFWNQLGFQSPFIWGGLLVAIVALVAVPFIEQRVSNPIIKLSLLRNRVFLSANLSLILSFLALYAVSFLMPFYFEQLRHFSPQETGFLLTPLPVVIAIVAPISGSIADKTKSTRWLTSGGLLIACIGLVLLGFLNAHSSIWDIIWRLIVTGFGQAMFQAPNNSALMGSAPPQERGSASGFLATGRVMGQGLSVALAGSIFTAMGAATAGALLQQQHSNAIALQQTFSTGFQLSLSLCAAVAFVGVLASLVRGDKEKGRAATH